MLSDVKQLVGGRVAVLPDSPRYSPIAACETDVFYVLDMSAHNTIVETMSIL